MILWLDEVRFTRFSFLDVNSLAECVLAHLTLFTRILPLRFLALPVVWVMLAKFAARFFASTRPTGLRQGYLQHVVLHFLLAE